MKAKKKAYQPPPTSAARASNSIGKNYDPAKVGTGPAYKDPITIPRAAPKGPRKNGDQNQWIFTNEQKKDKKKGKKGKKK